MKRLTSIQPKEFAERWTRVNQAEIVELAATPPEVALRQLDSLRSAIDLLEDRTERDREVDEVRSRWNRLRELAGA